MPRLGLMEAAQHSVDAQYFIVKNDRAGALFTEFEYTFSNCDSRGVLSKHEI